MQFTINKTEFKKENYLSRTAILIYIFIVISSVFVINYIFILNYDKGFLSESMAMYIAGAFFVSMASWNLSLILDKRKEKNATYIFRECLNKRFYRNYTLNYLLGLFIYNNIYDL